MASADREFVFDGSPAWSPEYALLVLEANGGLAALGATVAELAAASAPVPPEWLCDRLTIMWTVFMASRAAASPQALTIWMAEHLRLLGDLPHDIAAAAIDGALRQAAHGFMPSVGEIMAVATPMVAERSETLERLRQALKLAANVAGNHQGVNDASINGG